MREKLQRFGGAMFTPVLLFAFAGLILSISIMFQNPLLVGNIAAEGTKWSNFWSIVETGGWTVFNQMEILFVIGLPLGLARKSRGRAALESFVIYVTFNYFVNQILVLHGASIGMEVVDGVVNGVGIKSIAGITTFDTGLIGAIGIGALTVYIHDKYFDTILPEWIGIFQGSSLVVIIGFFLAIPLAYLTFFIWPKVQFGIQSLQTFLSNSKALGVWIYVFLERILIPTGLHHFIYQPFIYGPAVVEGGIAQHWFTNLNEFALSTQSLKALFPAGGFALHNASKLFAPLGISMAFYATARSDKKKQLMSLLIPTALTSILAGITEPFEFTFLFIAPQLFLVHSLLAATLGMTLYLVGVVGDIGSGLISVMTQFIIPMSINHKKEIFLLLFVGLIFVLIYFLVFRFLILRYDYETPGREKDEEIKLYTKKDYKEKQGSQGITGSKDLNSHNLIKGFGGVENIQKINNCATRLRVTVGDSTKVLEDSFFMEMGAHGVVKKENAYQIIVGLSAPQIREDLEIEVDRILNEED